MVQPYVILGTKESFEVKKKTHYISLTDLHTETLSLIRPDYGEMY